MSGPVQRRPWFWAALSAVAALFIFTIVIVAANRSDDGKDTTTIVRQPTEPESPQVVPVPVPPVSTSPLPASPSVPAAPPATPPVVRERTIIIPEDEAEKQRKATGQEASGKPERADRAPASEPEAAAPRVTEIKEFRSTGLPAEIRFEERGWKATEERTVTEPASELKSIGTTEDGAEVWVPMQAIEPYEQIYVAVLDEDGKYVVYRKR